MDTEDGQVFIKNLANFVKTHEKALANALYQHQRQNSRTGPDSGSQIVPSSPIIPYPATPSSSFASAFPFLGFGSRQARAAKLTLTPHHLFYLLSRFQELSRSQDVGVEVGPMDIRLENLHADASHAYVSFLNQAQRSKIRSEDRDSIHSITSIRSVMSSMSSLWTRLGLSTKSSAKTEKQKLQIQEDLKYLYSAFTKVPCLRLSPDHKAPLIAGYEEFPFDTAVPLLAFKNVTTLELCDVDFRQFYGWDRMADQLRSLTIRRGHIDDLSDLLVNIVLDDMDKRRRRSAKVPPSPILPWSAASPVLRHAELARCAGDGSPPNRPIAVGSPDAPVYAGKSHARQRSASPSRPASSRNGSSQGPSRSGTPNLRRSSASSGSLDRVNTPRGSSSNLLSFGFGHVSKWRFLRHLSLSDNGLSNISALSLAPVANTLQSLDLSCNLFTEIPDGLAALVSLRALNLSYCCINSLQSLAKSPVPAIGTFNLRGNDLSSLVGVERLFSLERIDLRDNKLTDPTEVARLTGIPHVTEVHVSRNPFTKTHPNYRVTIFNLFRKTPGFLGDIILDQQPPSYNEKKQLVDHAPELPSIPVVKLPAREEVIERLRPVSFATEPIIHYDPHADNRIATMPNRRKSQRGSQRRKRTTRRRVVEIAHEDNVSSTMPIPVDAHVANGHLPTDDSTYGGSVDANPTKARLDGTTNVEEDEAPSSKALPQVDVAGPSLAPATTEASKGLPQLPSDSELYKKRLETLRNDFGSAWLNALDDEASYSPLGPPSAPVRSVSQQIVSTGRTLG